MEFFKCYRIAGSWIFLLVPIAQSFSLEMLHTIVVTGFNLSEGFELTDFYWTHIMIKAKYYFIDFREKLSLTLRQVDG